jgi:hypothetical protein
MKRFATASFLLFALAGVASAGHPCGADAREKAASLLALHFGDDSDPSQQFIADEVTVLSPVRALKGNGKFDVLEVWGYIYKAEYRMHFLYAQIPGECVLMGQEILEASDPY